MKSQLHDYFPDRLIDEIKADPDNNYFTPVINEVLEHIQPRTICDIGCGNGVFSIQVKRLTTCHLTGVDGSEYALDQARELGFDVLHQVLDLSSERLPLENEAYDLVICKDVLEHLLNPEHLMGEMARIVKMRKGYALIHVPNHFPIVGRLKLLLTNNIDPFNYFPASNRWDFPHIRFFTMESLVELANKYGLNFFLDMSVKYFQMSKFSRLIPDNLKSFLVKRFPNEFTEGYTVLFQKI